MTDDTLSRVRERAGVRAEPARARSPSPAVRGPACKPGPLDGLAACGSKAPSRPQPSPAGERGSRIERAWAVLDGVLDPEVPVVSVVDLGIVRDVIDEGDALVVVVTPTYSGCPATEVIERDIVAALEADGLGPVRMTLQRAPAWTTDWISAGGKEKLRGYGIAPPGPVDLARGVPLHFVPRATVSLACPRCESLDTERLAAFGSTACKALWRCRACGEPFEHFKPI